MRSGTERQEGRRGDEASEGCPSRLTSPQLEGGQGAKKARVLTAEVWLGIS